jgi:hypothetical protein
MIINPYLIGAPALDKQFYGRHELMAELENFDQRFYFLNSVRRMGKTSVLKELERRVTMRGYWPVFLDASADDSNQGLKKSLFRSIRNYLDTKQIAIPSDWVEVQSFEDLLGQWIEFCKKSNYEAFLCIDEVEQFCKDGVLSNEAIQRITAHFNNARSHVKVIMTGSPKYIVMSKGRQSLSDFATLFITRFICPFDRQEAIKLMRKTQEENLVSVSDDEVDDFYSLVGGHPFLLQTICDAHYSITQNRLEEFDMNRIAIGSLDNFFEIDFNLLDDQQKKILVLLAEQSRTIQEVTIVASKKAASALTELIQLGIIRETTSKHLLFHYPIFGRWIDEHKYEVPNSINTSQPKKEAPAKRKVFISSSTQDKALLQQLCIHLSVMERKGQIHLWSENAILPGQEWDNATKENIANADIILCLLSADFLANSYIWDIEIPRALERHELGAAVVIPVILRHCDWPSTQLEKLGALPSNRVPITTFEDRDEAWLEVVKGVKHHI